MSKWKYVERIDLGYTMEGKRIQKRVYGNSKAELERNKQALYREYEGIRSPSECTFAEYAKRWRELYKRNMSIATDTYYDYLFRQFGRLGEIKLKDVERADVQECINGHWDTPSIADRLLWLVKTVLQSAVDDGYIVRNPAHDISRPKKPSKTARMIIDDNLLAAIKKAELSDSERLCVNILYLFGLRPGEMLALMSKDFKNGYLTVSRALTWDKQEPVLKETKTGNVRQIPVPAGFKVPKRMYLFEGKRGGLMYRSEWQQMWIVIRRKINAAAGGTKDIDALGKDFSAYTFRRNFATDLYYSGISLKKAAQLMGHADTTMLLKIYAQLDEARETTEKITARAENVI